MLEGLDKGNFRNLMIGDESWFALQFQHSTKWAVSRDDAPQKVMQQIDTSKFMPTVMWGVDGLHIVDSMSFQETINSQYFVDNVLTHILPKISP
jgi:hypothetical protein